MSYKQFIMIMAATWLNVAAFAQSVRFGVGTPFSKGIDLSIGYSHNVKGFVIGVSADWYNNLSGKEVSSDFYTWTQTSSDNLNIEMIDPDKHGSINNVSVLANAGYDVFRFLSDKRHHLTPSVGLGYSWMRTLGLYRSPFNPDDHAEVFTKQNGFEWSLGLSYGFSITKALTLSLSFERTMRVRKQNILALNVAYTF